MIQRAVLVDSAVFLHALGGDHPLKQPCRAALADEGFDLHASVELVQEVVFHRLRAASRSTAVVQAQEVAASCRLHPFDTTVLGRALALINGHAFGGRDAIHAATALVAGIPEILSPDPDFDGIAGLTRLDPRALAERS